MRDMLDEFIRQNINIRHSTIDTFHYCLKVFLLELAKQKDTNASITNQMLYPMVKSKVFSKLGSNTSNIFPELIKDKVLIGAGYGNNQSFQLDANFQQLLSTSPLWEEMQKEVSEQGYGKFDFVLAQRQPVAAMITRKRKVAVFFSSSSESELEDEQISDYWSESEVNEEDSAELRQLRVDITASYELASYKRIKRAIANDKKFVEDNHSKLTQTEQQLLDFIIAYTLVPNNDGWLTVAAIEKLFANGMVQIKLSDCLYKLDQCAYISYDDEKQLVSLNLIYLKTHSVHKFFPNPAVQPVSAETTTVTEKPDGLRPASIKFILN